MVSLMYKDTDNNWQSVFYPIGSFYFSTINTSPASIVGGIWTKVSDAVIRGTSDSSFGYIGEDEHALTIDEIPTHSHDITQLGFNDNAGSTSGHGTYYGRRNNTHPSTSNAGGGKRILLCNVLSTVLSGTGRLKNKRGVVVWL